MDWVMHTGVLHPHHKFDAVSVRSSVRLNQKTARAHADR
jgi:hypothetical protein